MSASALHSELSHERPRLWRLLPLIVSILANTATISPPGWASPAPQNGDCEERLWAGANNGDIFDEPDRADDAERALGAMLDRLASANLKVIRILIDYRLDLNDGDENLDGHADAMPIGKYNDCILEAIDHLMVEAKERRLLLLIALESHNWIEAYDLSRDHYSWRRCKTPALFYESLAADPNWEGGVYESPMLQRTRTRGWGNYLVDADAKEVYKKRVSHILHHRNPLLGNREWKDINDVVWAWELMSEPEYFFATNAELVSWLREMGAYVKTIDPDTYVALGTKDPRSVAGVDIKTRHHYPGHSPARGDFGDDRDELRLLEEFNVNIDFFRAAQDPDMFESIIEEAEERDIPWMFWEYGYKFDGDDIWHGGDDGKLWEDVIVPRARAMWNRRWTGTGKQWRVEAMINAFDLSLDDELNVDPRRVRVGEDLTARGSDSVEGLCGLAGSLHALVDLQVDEERVRAETIRSARTTATGDNRVEMEFRFFFEYGQEGRRQLTAIDLGRVGDHFAKADDHVERRAQLVADVGDKFFLRPPRFFGDLVHVLEAI